jgi:hypothetical protein
LRCLSRHRGPIPFRIQRHLPLSMVN